MSLDTVFRAAIGPYGVVFLLLVAVIYLWRALAEQKEATKAMEHQRDHWQNLYYLAIVAGERSANAAQTATMMLPEASSP